LSVLVTVKLAIDRVAADLEITTGNIGNLICFSSLFLSQAPVLRSTQWQDKQKEYY
jgi:hypothetical protein